MTEVRPYRARGIASWYGRRYHGQKTSSGEVYDMYGMTAAHPTLPIPSYVRVTNPVNGRTVVLRVNDRGPFKHDRLIDLSYTAAYKLDYVQKGSTEVEVELIIPGLNDSSAQPIAIGGGLDEIRPLPPLPSVSPSGPALSAGQIFLQLGVFSTRENAERLMQRVRTELPNMVSRARILQEGSQFRVHVGPWGSDDQARQAAEQIGRSLMSDPPIRVLR
jgi:rare lipoprotein A